MAKLEFCNFWSNSIVVKYALTSPSQWSNQPPKFLVKEIENLASLAQSNLVKTVPKYASKIGQCQTQPHSQREVSCLWLNMVKVPRKIILLTLEFELQNRSKIPSQTMLKILKSLLVKGPNRKVNTTNRKVFLRLELLCRSGFHIKNNIFT